MNKIELDHFESLEELLRTVKLWVKSEDPYDQVENRWFNTRELMEILEYTIKQKELIDKIKEMCIETEKHNDNCSGALDYEIIESNILDLIKEYENND